MNNDKSSFMHRSSLPQDNQKLTDINPNSLLSARDRCNSISNSSRNISPITFFHDGVTLPDIDFHNQCTAAQRRARAIATAPRRNRYDDDDEDEFEQKTSLLGLRKTSAVPIPPANDIRQTQSLPPIHHHHDAHLSPRSPTDSACSHGNEYYHRSYSSGPSPNNISLWRS